MTTNDHDDERGGVIGVRIPAELMRRIDSVAANEGISRADVVRRAAKFDVERRTAEASA
jgi:metal-responsive CopG/Arc/MetJ family transcriptional regulator